MNLLAKITTIKTAKTHLKKSLIGLEREGLRVSKNGISQTKHPMAFGSALTNPYITTDFSEALLEIVTPPLDIDGALSFLENTQHFIYKNLAPDEQFWAQSMPCVIRGETSIPIAKYGKSNMGKMRHIYRHGLANRYGSSMQVIAGVHFNYSYSKDFWQEYRKSLGDSSELRAFIDDNYMALVRNLLRFGWLIIYLFGASPAICESFLLNYHKHSLLRLKKGTLYEPYATSLRMGDVGYQNLKEDDIGVKANYNSLSHYINSLELAMQTPCNKYSKIGVKVDGEYKQLNANILQVENEYYSSVRPKQTPIGIEKPIISLKKRGIEYIELRSLDINPLTPLGVDKEQLLFLEAMFLFCLITPSATINSKERVDIDTNMNNIAHLGRNPSVALYNKGNKTTGKVWGQEICQGVALCADLLGEKHIKAVANISKRIADVKQTPSQQMIDLMLEKNQGFFDLSMELSTKYKSLYKDKPSNKKHFAMLVKDAQKSLLTQKIIEKDNINFDEYLQNYFKGD